MVKHTETIRCQQPTNCLSIFDHFVGLALKGLSLTLVNNIHTFTVSISFICKTFIWSIFILTISYTILTLLTPLMSTSVSYELSSSDSSFSVPLLPTLTINTEIKEKCPLFDFDYQQDTTYYTKTFETEHFLWK